MKRIISLSIFILLVSACNKPAKNVFTVKGEIKGLTKGMLYLEKVRDTTLVLIDSALVRKDGKYEMTDSLSSPEIYYLRLKDYPQDYILFFAEEGVITINSKVERFTSSAKISGSENQKLWEEYKKMISKFNDERLQLIKENFLAEKDNNQAKVDSIEKASVKNIKRRYLYTANYAVKHADKEIAPYLALTELYNANTYFLDTIAHSMNERTKNSLYGKQFLDYLKKTKEQKQDTTAVEK